MTKLILNASRGTRLSLETLSKNSHDRLKNLGFEESGHTGFQKELTKKQLENIDAVEGKEEASNKIQSIDEMTGDGTQYMSADLALQLIIGAEQTGANLGINHAELRFGQASERMDGIEGEMGEIETAIDNIIAIQNTLIGGESE